MPKPNSLPVLPELALNQTSAVNVEAGPKDADDAIAPELLPDVFAARSPGSTVSSGPATRRVTPAPYTGTGPDTAVAAPAASSSRQYTAGSSSRTADG